MSFLRLDGEEKNSQAKFQAAEKLLLGKGEEKKTFFHANHLPASCLLPGVPVYAY